MLSKMAPTLGWVTSLCALYIESRTCTFFSYLSNRISLTCYFHWLQCIGWRTCYCNIRGTFGIVGLCPGLVYIGNLYGNGFSCMVLYDWISVARRRRTQYWCSCALIIFKRAMLKIFNWTYSICNVHNIRFLRQTYRIDMNHPSHATFFSTIWYHFSTFVYLTSSNSESAML